MEEKIVALERNYQLTHEINLSEIMWLSARIKKDRLDLLDRIDKLTDKILNDRKLELERPRL